jgi:hypothetical protein
LPERYRFSVIKNNNITNIIANVDDEVDASERERNPQAALSVHSIQAGLNSLFSCHIRVVSRNRVYEMGCK